MIRLKGKNVVSDVQPALMMGLTVVEGVFRNFGVQEVVITSLNDGAHEFNSLHYQGLAADIRLVTHPYYNGYYTHALNQAILVESTRRLSKHFDLLLESDHFHLEYDPKTESDI